MTEVNAIIFYESHMDFKILECVSDKRVKIEGGKTSWMPSFTLSDFVPQELTSRSFPLMWRKKTKMKQWLLFREGLDKAIRPEGLEFSKHWTLEEAKIHVKKMVSKANEEGKPFSWGQLIPLYIILGSILAMVIYLVVRLVGG